MGISPTQLIIILVIVALLFGTKRLRNIGGDLGDAIKGFRKSMHEDETHQLQSDAQAAKDTAESVDLSRKEHA